jgi:hypothetical protein
MLNRTGRYRSELTFSDLGALGTEQNLCYFVACGLGELKVFSQVVANVLLSMLGFLDDPISNAFCDLRRVEALKHKVEEYGSQRSPPLATDREPGTLGLLANPSS